MNRDDPWDWSRQELAAYTALESGGNIDPRIVEKNLCDSGMSKRDAQGVLQAVVDSPKEKK